MKEKLALDPIINARSQTLILGTLPGDESLRLRQYYSDPTNQFWRILEGVYGETVGNTYESRIAFLHSKGLALWDVLQSAERSGSSDGSIKYATANDFTSLFARYPALTTVVLTGGRCATEWGKLQAPTGIRVLRVPSSSGTPGKYVRPFREKVAIWRAALKP